mmetsp:Transcript_24662/g.56142  ORF Transcript_24662/g.56142 Transcript_24662/m.56142 type:complete len:94 (-) Transcript_24662:143-424(-)
MFPSGDSAIHGAPDLGCLEPLARMPCERFAVGSTLLVLALHILHEDSGRAGRFLWLQDLAHHRKLPSAVLVEPFEHFTWLRRAEIRNGAYSLN